MRTCLHLGFYQNTPANIFKFLKNGHLLMHIFEEYDVQMHDLDTPNPDHT